MGRDNVGERVTNLSFAKDEKKEAIRFVRIAFALSGSFIIKGFI